jgi:long-chain acyl-CoA synthetase
MYDKTDDGWVASSYKQVEKRAKHLATALNNLGLNSEDNFAILSESRTNWVISEFAILYNRAASVPLSVKLLQEELPFRLNHSKSKGIFVSKNHLQKVINIWSEIDHDNFYLVYLDEDLDFLAKKTKEAGIPKSQVKSYSQLLSEGKEKYNTDSSKMIDLEKNVSVEDVVTISYTSGTTGNPKGIMLTHKNYHSNSKDGVTEFKITDKMKTLIILPIDHCFAHTTVIFGALFSGMSLYFLDTRGGAMNALKNIPINLKEVKPDYILTVPALSGNFMKKITDGIAAKGGFIETLFNKGLKAGIILNKDGYRKASFLKYLKYYPIHFIAKKLIFSKLKDTFGGNIKYLVGGGALLDIKQQQFFYSIGIPVYQGYGLTEATPVISINTPHIHKLGSSGKIIPSIDCKIKREDGSECKTGEKGEICIYGDSVMKGYFNNKEATNEAIRDNWLWTGDLGYYDEDNFLVVTGREKALLISEDGEKYSPEEIEEGLVYNSPLILQAIVHNNQRKFTSGIITLDDTNVKNYINKNNIKTATELYDIIENEIKSFKQDRVYMSKFPNKWMPSLFFIAPEPFTEDNKMVNSTMKVVRFKIEEVYHAEIDDMYSPNGSEYTKKRNIKTLNKKYFS